MPIVSALVAVAVTVPDPPRAILVPLTVKLAFANLACASVPELMFVALIEVTLAPDPLSVAIILPLVMLPVTLKLPNVPTEVTLGCAAVVSVPTILVPLKLPDVMLPVTLKLPNVPTEVTLVCAAVDNVPVNVVAVTVAAPKLPTLALPVALSVPAILAPVVVATNTLVPLGAKLMLPLAPVIIVNAPVSTRLPLVNKLPPVTLPVTLKLPNVPTEVMLVCAAVDNVPVNVVATTVAAPKLPTLALPLAVSVVT